jgi:hypothetical protein
MSVKIIDYKVREAAQDGRQFCVLIIQGGVEIVKSTNGNSYVTIRKVSLPTTFDEVTCQSLIGTELKGTIEKVDCLPYDYTIQETGEVIKLAHKWEYKEETQPEAEDFTKFYNHSSNGMKAVA